MGEKMISKLSMPYLRMGSGEPLVLIHGFTEWKEGWFKQFELASQYDLIIPDLRGHGTNPTLDGITMENFAGDVIELLNDLGIESAHICGYSMGGAVAQEIYRQAPEKCKSLILACTFFYAPKHLGKIVKEVRNLGSFFLSNDQKNLNAAKKCFYSWSIENFSAFQKGHKPNKEGVNKTIDAILEVDNCSLLPDIKIPTLVIGGQYDTLLPVWIQIQMYKKIPNAELCIFTKSGHGAKFEETQKFNQLLHQFIRKQSLISSR
ncbi:alpha/beta fold hydrolase [Neobacillus sp. NRS-1170]|uniref:alpha/beta fold hydrolase n=1 Tax=Neobacillus sp. NRS-1170 TaxID=3233898 RepID=UPI003D2769D1